MSFFKLMAPVAAVVGSLTLAGAALAARAEPAGVGVVRADADMGAVSLDQGGVPVFHDGVSM